VSLLLQTIYQDIILTAYNILYTSLPPLLISIFEKDLLEEEIFNVSAAFVACFTYFIRNGFNLNHLQQNPEVFIESSQGLRFNMKTTFGWSLSAAIHTTSEIWFSQLGGFFF
jgi:magnesium-transporting ATPase (P-type)